MKVTLISPPFPFSGRVPIVPPILEYLGALTLREMPGVELELIDANVREPSVENIEADIVGISAMTATVTWAYGFADKLMALGKKVVLGGIHPTALPEEAGLHADAVVVGEAESVLGDVLRDASEGALKQFYNGERLPLDDMPMPLTGMLKGPYKFRAVFTARGCPYQCTFCSVRKFFGDTIRYRPIERVAEEVERYAGRVYFNGDDNIWGGDIKRSTELFGELSRGSRKWWYGFGDLRSVQLPGGERMVKAARKSGLFSVWVGWETSSADGLRVYHAGAKQGRQREDAIKIMKDQGIDVVLFIVLGARNENAEAFEQTVELAERLGVSIHPVLLTPLPGTELYEEYRPFLLADRGWEYYTGASAVFEHPELSPAEMERIYYKTSLKLMNPGRIFGHIFDINLKGFPMTHLLSLMKQIPVRRAMKKAYGEWAEKMPKKAIKTTC